MSDYEDDFDTDSPAKGSWLKPIDKKKDSSPKAAVAQSPPRKRTPSPASSRRSYSSDSRRDSRRSSRSSSRSYASRRSTPRSPVRSARTPFDAEPAVAPARAPHAGATKTHGDGPSPVKEIAMLRLKNAELQRAISAVRDQLAKIAPRLGPSVKRKHSSENDRMNRLQQEATTLQQEHAALVKKLRDVEHIKELEKQLAARETEVKQLQERNKNLQLEIRNNAKKLKQASNIEEQRAHLLDEIKQERKVAIQSLEKAQRDAELAAQSRDAVQKRLTALEQRDRLPELKAEDVKLLLDMKATLASKIETIESLQYRLSVLKRAHESVHRTIVANPGELAEIETLKAEVGALKARLASGVSEAAPAAQDSRPAKKDKPAKVAESDSKPASRKVASTPSSTPAAATPAPSRAAEPTVVSRTSTTPPVPAADVPVTSAAPERPSSSHRAALRSVEESERQSRDELTEDWSASESSLAATERTAMAALKKKRDDSFAAAAAAAKQQAEAKAKADGEAAAAKAKSGEPSWLDD